MYFMFAAIFLWNDGAMAFGSTSFTCIVLCFNRKWSLFVCVNMFWEKCLPDLISCFCKWYQLFFTAMSHDDKSWNQIKHISFCSDVVLLAQMLCISKHNSWQSAVLSDVCSWNACEKLVKLVNVVCTVINHSSSVSTDEYRKLKQISNGNCLSHKYKLKE